MKDLLRPTEINTSDFGNAKDLKEIESIDHKLTTLAPESEPFFMHNDAEIITESDGNNKLKLIFNESILLTKREEIISVKIKTPKVWTLRFHFTNNTSEEANSSRFESAPEENTANVYLNKWMTTTWVENTAAWPFTSKDKKVTLLVKIRSSADLKYDTIRSLTLSIWKKI